MAYFSGRKQPKVPGISILGDWVNSPQLLALA
jgi:hypothetical protein